MDINNESELQKLHESCKEQLSGLTFLDDEAKFLKSLLEKYFPSMVRDTHMNRVQLISSQLLQLCKLKAIIHRDTELHQVNLNSTINNLSAKSLGFLNLENDRIDDEIKDLNKYFKNIKVEIFTVYKEHHEDISG